MKRMISVLLVCVFVLGLAACGGKKPSPQPASSAPAPTPTPLPAATPAPTPTPEPDFNEAAVNELRDMLDEIEREGSYATAGSSLTAVRLAAHLMNWGVGTTLTPDVIADTTLGWMCERSGDDQLEFSKKLEPVGEAYRKLLGGDEESERLLEDAGCREEAAWPWSDEAIATVEAVLDSVNGAIYEK